MTPLYFHLLVNDVPTLFLAIGLVIFFTGLVAHSKVLEWVGLVLIGFGGLVAIATYVSGNQAEYTLMRYPEKERFVKEHQKASKLPTFLSAATSGMAFGLMFLRRRSKWESLSRILSALIFSTALLSLVLLIRTSHLGGLVGHEELRQKASLPGSPN